MTRWIEDPRGGRGRGPRGLARAWLEVLVRPSRFFRVGVSPGDQALGLTFLLAVVSCVEVTRYALVSGAYPEVPISRPLGALFWLSLVVLLVAPLGLHAVAAVQTLLLVPFVSDRAGTSQTVQVIAYSSAPCVLAGLPYPPIRALCAVYGTVLLFIGLRIVHDTTTIRTVAAGSIPAALVFGFGFRGFAALRELGIAM